MDKEFFEQSMNRQMQMTIPTALFSRECERPLTRQQVFSGAGTAFPCRALPYLCSIPGLPLAHSCRGAEMIDSLTVIGRTVSSRRFIVLVCDGGVELQRTRFWGLLILTPVRLSSRSGRADLCNFESAGVVYGRDSLHQFIRRIRCGLNGTPSDEIGDRLILHGEGSRHSLAVKRDSIRVLSEFSEIEDTRAKQFF